MVVIACCLECSAAVLRNGRVGLSVSCLQLLNAADAKVAYGLVKNWEPLKAVVQALMEEETLSGDRLMQILKDSNAEFFPDPFVAGFDRGDDGHVVYPGSDKPGAAKVTFARNFTSQAQSSCCNPLAANALLALHLSHG